MPPEPRPQDSSSPLSTDLLHWSNLQLRRRIIPLRWIYATTKWQSFQRRYLLASIDRHISCVPQQVYLRESGRQTPRAVLTDAFDDCSMSIRFGARTIEFGINI